MIQFIKDIINNIKSKLDSRGQGMVEYAVVLAAVAAIVVAVMYGSGTTGDSQTKGKLQQSVESAFDKANSKIDAVQ